MNSKDTTITASIFGADATAIVMTAVQPNEILQWISLVLTIVATAISIVLSIWRWWKMAKKDGKIDEDEIEELQNIIDSHMPKGKEEKKDDE